MDRLAENGIAMSIREAILAYGGQFGKRGMQDALKAGAVQSRRSRAPAFLFSIFGVKKGPEWEEREETSKK
ncbi:hypothetical protein H5410_050130 [Solanum commersonii]|uniref:Uncharacterized protein n=1 Tax=Solanum commersonii TaxID=4109 RepID=A0A9J5WVY7_SOLCO|nr:hypothetical protein H5410_050130 [Solanum commersonii]